MTTYAKTKRLAELIGIDHHASDSKQTVWRQVKQPSAYPFTREAWPEWRPYECLANLEPLLRWLEKEHPAWLHSQPYECQAAYCDAVLAAFDPKPEPNERTTDTRGPACVVRGSVLSGFTFRGPFATVEAAAVWCESVDQEPSTVVLLEPPEPTELAEHHEACRNEWRERAERAEAELAAVRELAASHVERIERLKTKLLDAGRARELALAELAQCEAAINGLCDVISDRERERTICSKLLAACVDSAGEELAAKARPCIPWRPCAEHGDTFEDGEQMMVAVPVRDNLTGNFHWEIECVVADVDEYADTCDLESLHGDYWGWAWENVQWWLPMSEVLGTLPAVDAARAAEGSE